MLNQREHYCIGIFSLISCLSPVRQDSQTQKTQSRLSPIEPLKNKTVDIQDILFLALFFFFFFFLSFQSHTWGTWKFPGQGSNRSCSCQPTPESQQHGIQDLHCSSWQQWILNPLSEARDRTYILIGTIRFLTCRVTMGTPPTKQQIFQEILNIKESTHILHLSRVSHTD